jgi:pimeloyl-ACP methyl ester carboxylesterase
VPGRPATPARREIVRSGPPLVSAIGLRLYGSPGTSEGPICVWLPGRAGNFDAVLLGRREDPRAVLSAAGLTVYAVDCRTAFVDPHVPWQRAMVGTWDLGTFIDDVDWVVDMTRRRHPRRPIVLIGHSTGARLAYLCAARAPRTRVSGLISLDGWVRSPPHMVSDRDRAALRHAVRIWREGKEKVRFTREPERDPDRAAALSRRLALFLRSAAVGPASPAGRMIGRAADAGTAAMVARCLLAADRCWPVAAELESRAMGLDMRLPGLRTYDEHLPDISADLLNVVAGDRGAEFVPKSLYTGSLLRSTSKKEVVISGVGHMDLVIGSAFSSKVVPMILEWLEDRYGHSSSVPESDDANRPCSGWMKGCMIAG